MRSPWGLDPPEGPLKTSFEEHKERIGSLERSILDRITATSGNSNHLSKSKWSWAKFCYGVSTRDWSNCSFEKDEMAKWHDKKNKALMIGGESTLGGSLIPPQYIAELIEFLRPELITARLGVRIITGLIGSPVTYPKLTSGASANWIAPEGTTITVSNQVTGALQLQPKKCASLVKMSRELQTLSNPSIEAGVRADIVMTLQEALDTAFFQGTGVGGQPTGLEKWSPAIPTAGGTWEGAPTPTEALANLNVLKNFRQTLGNANALKGRVAWAVNVDTYEAIDRLYDANNRPFLVPDPGNGLRGTLLGFPIESSTLVSPTATDTGYFGNWNDAILALWNNISVEASTEADTAFANDELWIKATVLADVGIRREASFAQKPAMIE
jgi:HK97 family phage major capsid protein